MTAFIHNELPPEARRRVARYIDESPACYKVYIQQRALQQELSRSLPAFGQPAPQQLDQLWLSIQSDLFTPERRRRPTLQLRYGLATFVLVMSFMLPMFWSENTITQAASTPPTPAEVVAASTTSAPGTNALEATAASTRKFNHDVIRPEAVPQGTPQAGE
ncbi:MAG: hypothetical protein OHK0046_34730 [Anaerolineae bacterium]